MLASVDWETVALPASFVVGALTGTLVTLRMMRALLDYLRAEQRRNRG